MNRSTWIGLRPSPSVVVVLVTLVAVFLALKLAGTPAWVIEHLVMHPRAALGREPWQLVTSPLIHVDFGTLISSGVGIWLFGTPVEQRRGRAYLYRVLAGATLVGSLASALYGRLFAPDELVAGAGPASLAMIAAFGVQYGRTPLLLFGVQEMRASTTALIFLGINAIMYVVHRDFVGLAGAAAGAAWGAYGDAWLDLGRISGAWSRWRLSRLKRRYKVLQGGRDNKRYWN